jgi:DNA-binding CsgD family transcriptional regulator
MISTPLRARRLVGRAPECAFFEARATAAIRGQGAVAILLGGAGEGKTRLMRTWASNAEAHGFAVAAARNYAFARTPYAPIIDILAPLVAREPRALPSSLQERALLERLLTSSVPEPHGTEPQPWEKRRLLALIGRTLARIASIGPLAIFVDDAQWLDAESLEVLQYLAAACKDQRFVIALSARSEPSERSAGFDDMLQALDRLDGVHQVALQPLDDGQVRELILATAPASDALSQHMVSAICRLSEGNPLFVEDLVRDALARPGANDLLPRSVEQSVRRRIKELDEADAAYLEMAAAVGPTFDVSLVAELAETSETAIEPMLLMARELDLIVADERKPGSFQFRHELTRVAVSAGSLPKKRREIHRRIATTLERTRAADTPDATLAWHWKRAGDITCAGRYAERAGDAAVAGCALLSAREHYELAASDSSLPDDRRWEVEEKLGRVAGALGDFSDAATRFAKILAQARRLGDRTRIFRALSGLRQATFGAGFIEAALGLADEAIALVDPQAPEALESFSAAAFIAAGLFENGKVEAERVEGYITRARLGAGGGDIASELRLLFCEGALAVFREDAAAAREKYLTCASVARGAENPGHRSMGLKYAVWIAGELADFSAVRSMVTEFIVVADELGAAYNSAGSRVLAAHTAYFLGDIAEALDLIYAACAQNVPSTLMRMNLAAYGTPIALAANDSLLLQRVAALDVLEETLAGGTLETLPSAFVAVQIELAALQGADERRRQLVDHAMKAVTATVYRDGLLFSLARYADADRLDAITGLVPDDHGAVGLAAIYRSLARATLAKRGNDSATRDLVARAVELARRFGSPILEATAYEVGGNLRDAIDTYRSVGALGHVRRLEPGARSSRRTMSRREREVAELVGHGMSNRAIGERLSISERTVEHHIGSLFNKLGLRSRAELMAYVIRSTTADHGRASGN